MLAIGNQSVIEFFHDWVALYGAEHGHVENGSDGGSASANPSLALHGSTVSVVGS